MKTKMFELRGNIQQPAFKIALFIALVGCLMYLPGLGQIGLFDSSDSYYSEGAREMLERGNLLVPYLNYSQYFEKPILNYWLIILSYKIFGIAPFAARLPSALSTVSIAVLIYLKTRKFAGDKVSVLAAAIFLTSPIVLIVGRFSLTDMPLCLLETASILFLFEGVLLKKRGSLIAGYVAGALAILTKGPVAVAIIGGVLALFALTRAIVRKDARVILEHIKKMEVLPGILLVCAIALPWYIAIHIATAGAFTQYFFIGQNLGRALGKVNHTAPWFYYIPMFLASFFPWSVLLIPRLFDRHKLVPITGKKELLLSLCWCWIALVFILFSITPTKLPTYILPLYPPAAVLLSCLICEGVSQNKFAQLRLGGLILSGITAVAAIFLPLFVTGAISFKTLFSLQHFQPGKIAQAFTGSYFSLELWAAAVAGASFIYLWLLLTDMPRQAVIAFSSMMLLISGCFTPLAIQHFYQIRQAGFTKLVQLAGDMNLPLATVEAFQPSASFTLHRRVPVLKTPADLKNFLSDAQSNHLLLIPDSRMLTLIWLDRPATSICSNGGWTLVSVRQP